MEAPGLLRLSPNAVLLRKNAGTRGPIPSPALLRLLWPASACRPEPSPESQFSCRKTDVARGGVRGRTGPGGSSAIRLRDAAPPARATGSLVGRQLGSRRPRPGGASSHLTFGFLLPGGRVPGTLRDGGLKTSVSRPRPLVWRVGQGERETRLERPVLSLAPNRRAPRPPVRQDAACGSEPERGKSTGARAWFFPTLAFYVWFVETKPLRHTRL